MLSVACSLGCGRATSNGSAPTPAGEGATGGVNEAGSSTNAGDGAIDVGGATAAGARPSQGGSGSSSAGADSAGEPSLGGEANGGAAGAPVESCTAPGARFATSVTDHAFGGGQNFNQSKFPAPLFGPPEANEPMSVLSLGNGGYVVLAFDGNAIVDGPGVDFTVFENPLPVFQELATVAVSEDGESWFEFPCTAAQDGPDYGACAGVALVYSSSANGIDPLDPAVSGGDHYDLAELGLSRARFVRITDRADLVGGTADVFDLDAVALVNAECP